MPADYTVGRTLAEPADHLLEQRSPRSLGGHGLAERLGRRMGISRSRVSRLRERARQFVCGQEGI
jgi:hypothetical protein